MDNIVPKNEPFFLPGGSTGCLLLHGFSSMPEEMRPLGDHLAEYGFTVLGARLTGHATYPGELRNTRWTDWLKDVEDGLAVLVKMCTRRVLIGQSLGGMIALTAAASMNVSTVITLSSPYGVPRSERLVDWLQRLLQPTIHKKVARFPPEHPLYHRRELNYPAYPEFPSPILTEMHRLGQAMLIALPNVKVPVLLIHSKDDPGIPLTHMESIYDHLGSQHKQSMVVEGMGHSLVMDPKREVVFNAITEFLNAIGEENQEG